MMKNKFKIIKNLYNYNLYINLMNLNNFKINYFYIKKIYNMLPKFNTNMKFVYLNVKNSLKHSIKFVKFFCMYIISKYYYKLNPIDFIIKVRTDRNLFNFFVTLNKIKQFLTLTKKEDKPFVRLMYYYTLTIMWCLAIGPISWFLLRVVTDKINWMMYVFDHTNLSLLL